MVEPALAKLDEVCARIERPEHFTDHPHCDECFEADQFFSKQTPASLGELDEPPETLPLAFLTSGAIRYFLPALVRMLIRDPASADVLILTENRLDVLTTEEAQALRDVLYAVYDKNASGFHSGFFSYETLWRVLERLDERLR